MEAGEQLLGVPQPPPLDPSKAALKAEYEAMTEESVVRKLAPSRGGQPAFAVTTSTLQTARKLVKQSYDLGCHEHTLPIIVNGLKRVLAAQISSYPRDEFEPCSIGDDINELMHDGDPAMRQWVAQTMEGLYESIAKPLLFLTFFDRLFKRSGLFTLLGSKLVVVFLLVIVLITPVDRSGRLLSCFARQ